MSEAGTDLTPRKLTGQLAPLRAANPEEVLDRYLAGETGPQIAQSFGVTKQALSLWMLKHCEQEYKEAQIVKAIERKERAEQDLDDIRAEIAKDFPNANLTTMDREERERLTARLALDHARARACESALKAAQWDLERVCRRIYGTDQPPSGTNAVQINISLRRENATVAVQQGNIIDSAPVGEVTKP